MRDFGFRCAAPILGFSQFCDNFGNAKQAHSDGNQTDTLSQAQKSKGEAGDAGIQIQANYAQYQPECHHNQRLQGRPIRHGTGRDQAQQHHGKIFR